MKGIATIMRRAGLTFIVSPEMLPRMSASQYLDYEQTQEIRHELVDGYLYAMVGANRGTAKITVLDAPDDKIAISGLEFSISLQELYA